MNLTTWTFPHLLCLLFSLCRSSTATPANVLIYSATRAFRHDSIPTAIDALQKGSGPANIVFNATEDHSQFTDSVLVNYDAAVFDYFELAVLDSDGLAAFKRWLDLGGNFMGIHSASDSLNHTDFFVAELGTSFDYHPPLQQAIVNVIGPAHPSTAKLPVNWTVSDEMYNFNSDPRDVGAVVILSADESSYVDTGTRKKQGSPHPTAWYQEHGAGSSGTAGRSFYTSLGHKNETWQDELFMSHIFGGIQWSLHSNTTRAYNDSAMVGAGSNQSSITATSSAPIAKATSTNGTSFTFTFLTAVLIGVCGLYSIRRL